MIRLVYVCRRLPSLSREEFQGYWREKHGPLVAKHATAMRIHRYVQTHTIAEITDGTLREGFGQTAAYDGVAELWWDNLDELTAIAQAPKGQQAWQELLDDERNFIDFPRSSMWLATELPQVNPTPENIVAREENTIIKIFYVFRHLPSLSLEEAQLYWRMNHGPLLRRWAQPARIRRYLQVHMLPGPLNDLVRAPYGAMEEPYTGHAELWYDRLDLAASATGPEYMRAMQLFAQDEAKFIDFSKSAMWFAKEHVFVDR